MAAVYLVYLKVVCVQGEDEAISKLNAVATGNSGNTYDDDYAVIPFLPTSLPRSGVVTWAAVPETIPHEDGICTGQNSSLFLYWL